MLDKDCGMGTILSRCALSGLGVGRSQPRPDGLGYRVIGPLGRPMPNVVYNSALADLSRDSGDRQRRSNGLITSLDVHVIGLLGRFLTISRATI